MENNEHKKLVKAIIDHFESKGRKIISAAYDGFEKCGFKGKITSGYPFSDLWNHSLGI